MRGLKDKVAIVAGAAPGNIGGATAIRLAEEGMLVVAADLNQAAAQTVVDHITAAGGTAVARGCDITDESSYRELISSTVDRFGGLHGLFNVAADLSAHNVGRDTDVTSVPVDVWQHTIDVTLTGYMYGIRHALPIMIKQGSGSIINTMSSILWMGEKDHVAYQAAKSGLIGLTRHTATLGGKHGVRTNLVSPGVILTGAALKTTTAEYREQILATVRSPRLGKPEDLAAMVARSSSPTTAPTSTASRCSSTVAPTSPDPHRTRARSEHAPPASMRRRRSHSCRINQGGQSSPGVSGSCARLTTSPTAPPPAGATCESSSTSGIRATPKARML